MSLKNARFHVEPVFNYRGNIVSPCFGTPDEYLERTVDWIKGCPVPQTYGCYTLWKVLHQQRRIDVLEKIVERLIHDVSSLRHKVRRAENEVKIKCGSCKKYDKYCRCK
jgi:hypothetical protein